MADEDDDRQNDMATFDRLVAYHSGPFREHRPESPFNSMDIVSYPDVTSARIQEKATERNPVKTFATWARSWLPHFAEPDEEKAQVPGVLGYMAGDRPQGQMAPGPRTASEALMSFGKHLANFGIGVIDAPLAAMEHYADWQKHGLGEGKPSALLVPPDLPLGALRRAPGMRGMIERGEASPTSTFDAFRGRWDKATVWPDDLNYGIMGEYSTQEPRPSIGAMPEAEKGRLGIKEAADVAQGFQPAPGVGNFTVGQIQANIKALADMRQQAARAAMDKDLTPEQQKEFRDTGRQVWQLEAEFTKRLREALKSGPASPVGISKDAQGNLVSRGPANERGTVADRFRLVEPDEGTTLNAKTGDERVAGLIGGTSNKAFLDKMRDRVAQMRYEGAGKGDIRSAVAQMRREEFGRLWRQDMPTDKIAEQLGLSPTRTQRAKLGPELEPRARAWQKDKAWEGRKEELFERYRAGDSIEDLTKRFGFKSGTTIATALRRLGFPEGELRPNPKVRTPEQNALLEKIIERRRQGQSYGDIGGELGIPRGKAVGLAWRARRGGREVLAETGPDERLAALAGQAQRPTELLPRTQKVLQWLKEGGIDNPDVRIGKTTAARSRAPSNYVDLPWTLEARKRGLPRTTIRIPPDNHLSKNIPGKGLIDTGMQDPRRIRKTDPYNLTTQNAMGELYANPKVLEEVINWLTTRKLVSPGKEPRWARYPEEEPAAKPIEGADFHPDQLKLLAKTGDKRLAAILGNVDRSKALEIAKATQGLPDNLVANVMQKQLGITPGQGPWWKDLLSAERGKMRSAARDQGFPDRFWQAIREEGGNQQKVAQRLGLSQATVARYKQQLTPPADLAGKIPNALQKRKVSEADFRAAYAKHGGRMDDVAKEVGLSTAQAYAYRNEYRPAPRKQVLIPKGIERLKKVAQQLAPAERELRSQQMRSKGELAEREGKPFWDKQGRLNAERNDWDYVRELAEKLKGGKKLEAKVGDERLAGLMVQRRQHEEALWRLMKRHDLNDRADAVRKGVGAEWDKHDKALKNLRSSLEAVGRKPLDMRSLAPATPWDEPRTKGLRTEGYSVMRGDRMDRLKEAYARGASEKELWDIAHSATGDKYGLHWSDPEYRVTSTGKRETAIPEHGWKNLLKWLKTGREP